MTTTASESFVIHGEHVAEGLESVRANLPADGGELLLDFFFVQALNPAGIRALEDLAGAADLLKAKVVLRGVNVEIYKVLKLAQLTERFLFVN